MTSILRLAFTHILQSFSVKPNSHHNTAPKTANPASHGASTCAAPAVYTPVGFAPPIVAGSCVASVVGVAVLGTPLVTGAAPPTLVGLGGHGAGAAPPVPGPAGCDHSPSPPLPLPPCPLPLPPPGAPLPLPPPGAASPVGRGFLPGTPFPGPIPPWPPVGLTQSPWPSPLPPWAPVAVGACHTEPPGVKGFTVRGTRVVTVSPGMQPCATSLQT